MILDGKMLAEFFRERIQGALAGHSLEVSETTEFYLVNLLTDFERTDHLFTQAGDSFVEEPLALMLARAINGDTSTQVRELKRLGDTALYLTGLFADHIEASPVSVKYYVDMGSGAYDALAGQMADADVFAELYSELSHKFYDLAMVIGDIGINEFANTNSELLHIYERWLKTGNEKLRDRLIKEGILPVDFCQTIV